MLVPLDAVWSRDFRLRAGWVVGQGLGSVDVELVGSGQQMPCNFYGGGVTTCNNSHVVLVFFCFFLFLN